MSAADKREILGSEDVSMHSVDDILVAPPEFTALSAKTEDITSVGEDGECVKLARHEPGTWDEVVKNLPTTSACSTDVISSAGAKPRLSSDYCPREDDELICCQISGRRNVQDYISTAVREVANNSWNASNNGLRFPVSLEHDSCEEHHERECEDDKSGLVGILAASEAASDLRYVSSLFITLVNEPSFSQTQMPLCSNNDESFVTNVSKRICPSPIRKFNWLLCMPCLACRLGIYHHP